MTHAERVELCEYYYDVMGEGEVHDIVIENLLDWLNDFGDDELQEMYDKMYSKEV